MLGLDGHATPPADVDKGRDWVAWHVAAGHFPGVGRMVAHGAVISSSNLRTARENRSALACVQCRRPLVRSDR